VLGRLRADVGVLGDHYEVVTRASAQGCSELSLCDITIRHAKALDSAVALQHEKLVNLHQIHLYKAAGKGPRYCARKRSGVKSGNVF
jgi:hypothetical protein